MEHQANEGTPELRRAARLSVAPMMDGMVVLDCRLKSVS